MNSFSSSALCPQTLHAHKSPAGDLCHRSGFCPRGRALFILPRERFETVDGQAHVGEALLVLGDDVALKIACVKIEADVFENVAAL